MTEARTNSTHRAGLFRFVMAGLITALLAGAGSFFAVYTGRIDLPFTKAETPAETPTVTRQAKVPAFVALDPVLVSLPRTDPPLQLRFMSTLEVSHRAAAEIEQMRPRIMDVTNTYLRATELSDVRDPAALSRIRAQLLRRIQVATGSQGIHDLLITQFLVN